MDPTFTPNSLLSPSLSEHSIIELTSVDSILSDRDLLTELMLTFHESLTVTPNIIEHKRPHSLWLVGWFVITLGNGCIQNIS